MWTGATNSTFAARDNLCWIYWAGEHSFNNNIFLKNIEFKINVDQMKNEFINVTIGAYHL